MTARGWADALRVPALAGGLAALLASACDLPSGADATRVATVTVDAAPLLAAGHGGVASVLDMAELVVAHAEGGITVVRAPITADEPTAELEVEVGGGVHRFEARVFSNDGTPLFEGSTDAEVRSQGFAVEIQLRAVAGVLVIAPDSVRIPWGGQLVGGFEVENRGSDWLFWQVVEVDPPLISCDAPCLRMDPSGGELGPGTTTSMQVVASRIAAGVYTLRVASTVGDLELRVFVDTAGVGAPPRPLGGP